MKCFRRSAPVPAEHPDLEIQKQSPSDRVIALAGNPNVGKSTLFNSLTGLRQHTGNWPGKTVSSAQGCVKTASGSCILVDIPGTYSLMAHSAEEEVARNFLCFGNIDGVVVVCDATCLERNLNLVLQTLELSENAIVCVNLMDEAAKKHIHVDLEKLSVLLGVPVVGIVARKKKSLQALIKELDQLPDSRPRPFQITYAPPVEKAVSILEPAVQAKMASLSQTAPNSRWLALKLLEGDKKLIRELENFLGQDILSEDEAGFAYFQAKMVLEDHGLFAEPFKDSLVQTLVDCAETIASQTVSVQNQGYNERDRRIDRFLTSRLTGYPVMAGLLALIFWLTITGANYPSRLLALALFRLQDLLSALFLSAGAPQWLHGMVVLGMYRVLAWVISVMLPPMAIFFPLFTLLEDSGYLPRIAYNLDKPFERCHACGKQALTMCMGFENLQRNFYRIL